MRWISVRSEDTHTPRFTTKSSGWRSHLEVSQRHKGNRLHCLADNLREKSKFSAQRVSSFLRHLIVKCSHRAWNPRGELMHSPAGTQLKDTGLVLLQLRRPLSNQPAEGVPFKLSFSPHTCGQRQPPALRTPARHQCFSFKV